MFVQFTPIVMQGSQSNVVGVEVYNVMWCLYKGAVVKRGALGVWQCLCYIYRDMHDIVCTP